MSAAKAKELDVGTQLTVFDPHGSSGYLLSVLDGAPISRALESASCRLCEVMTFLMELSDEEEGISQNSVYLVHRSLEAAKALVDATASSIAARQRAGGAE